MAYTKPKQWKKKDSERLRGGRDQIKAIDLGFERWQVVRFKKARRRQGVPFRGMGVRCSTQLAGRSLTEVLAVLA